ncbi:MULTISPECIES: murein hydrolase activator NlpD [Vibrio]|uniref:murein hydrolase activator NlpD n=1 Tax=Vibrio TaxID=662 RepID=UPI00207555A3|nr:MULTISPECIES: murein hydrolase activator NlpD [Vibrio]USD32145.1 murein hydrolase activator NlpD [Vibrio sp. SCSIO 43186]USD45188.1 murein hydrolase activator NlpD [Vibrio sp. SCSIO 43145]USD69271.1 murein hydrolase activator NlpD [Vibrio sp. SCSIO 43139]USD96959.1 murein hydrolase activator NlpD [Vibrio coralliilyticus]
MMLWSKFFPVVAVSSILIGCAAHSPAPVSGLNKDYSSISRGSYRGSYYQVKKGDTLYFIAYVTDKDVKDIIRYNGLTKPYTIFPGQKLKLWQPAYNPPAYGGTGAGTVSPPVAVAVASTPSVNSSKNSNQSVSNKGTQSKPSVAKKEPIKKVDQSKSKEYVGSKSKQNVNKPVSGSKPKNEKISRWLWPTKGRVIKNFSAGDQGNKGIDIAGQRGQPISSTASGTVVYSGNALRGYGNLVIIKHNDNYLSAYAHNERLLVHEGQSVKAGQKIATMGSSGTNSVRLHFEIRYQGKSVNPKRYLP